MTTTWAIAVVAITILIAFFWWTSQKKGRARRSGRPFQRVGTSQREEFPRFDTGNNSDSARFPIDWSRKQGRKYPLAIVGESHYQEVLSDICGGPKREGHFFETEAILTTEGANPYDPLAVGICIRDRTVGYLSMENARKYRALLKQDGGTPTRTAAVIMGGWSRGTAEVGSFGVFLALKLPPTIKRKKKSTRKS